MSSSSRRILQSMLSPENNATRNDPHNSSNARTRLANVLKTRIQIKNAEQNNTLVHTMTAINSEGLVYQFASDDEENIDQLRTRNLLHDLKMMQIPASFCKELGNELYYNTDCYPYFLYADNGYTHEPKMNINTLLAIFACNPNVTALSDMKLATINDYCENYIPSDDDSPLPMVFGVAFGIILLCACCCAIGLDRKKRLAAQPPTAPHDPLRQRLLAGNNAAQANVQQPQPAQPEPGEQEGERSRFTLS